MPTILILGAADTGRAPMTAAMLRQILEQRQLAYSVASAGILGHDGDSPTGDAISTMDQMNLDITEYVARSLNQELATEAALLIAVDSGTAHVARAQYPEIAKRLFTLGELAGRERDIPDPFKMAMAAWLTYASEIDRMLRTALPRILKELGDPSANNQLPEPTFIPDAPAIHSVSEPVAVAIPAERAAAIVRIQRMLSAIEQLPAIIDWRAARSQLETDLDACQIPIAATDLAPALVGLLRAALALTPNLPTIAQLTALHEAATLLEHPITQAELAMFSLQIGVWQS